MDFADCASQEEAPKAAPVTWVRYETEAGEHYYFNVQTNVTQWDAPPTFVTAAQYELVKAGNASTTGSQAYLPDDTPQQPAAAPVAQETVRLLESDAWRLRLHVSF